MAFLSINELVDVVIMTVVVGYIFMDVFPVHQVITDPLQAFKRRRWDSFVLSVIVTAPAVILHELGHKLVGIMFGLDAVFHAAYKWLVIGLVLKWMNFMVFFVPGYVSISGQATVLERALTAFAGPGINLALFLAAYLILRYKKVSSRTQHVLLLTRKINGFLFIFNMLPIPPFDGFSVFSNLISYFT